MVAQDGGKRAWDSGVKRASAKNARVDRRASCGYVGEGETRTCVERERARVKPKAWPKSGRRAVTDGRRRKCDAKTDGQSASRTNARGSKLERKADRAYRLDRGRYSPTARFSGAVAILSALQLALQSADGSRLVESKLRRSNKQQRCVVGTATMSASTSIREA